MKRVYVLTLDPECLHAGDLAEIRGVYTSLEKAKDAGLAYARSAGEASPKWDNVDADEVPGFGMVLFAANPEEGYKDALFVEEFILDGDS